MMNKQWELWSTTRMETLVIFGPFTPIYELLPMSSAMLVDWLTATLFWWIFPPKWRNLLINFKHVEIRFACRTLLPNQGGFAHLKSILFASPCDSFPYAQLSCWGGYSLPEIFLHFGFLFTCKSLLAIFHSLLWLFRYGSILRLIIYLLNIPEWLTAISYKKN